MKKSRLVLKLSFFLFLFCCHCSFAQQQGCLYKYNSSDQRIFTKPSGFNKTYNDQAGPISNNPNGSITSPAYDGSARPGYTIFVYGANDCVSPDPSTRLSQTSNCVIWDGDSYMYPGYLVTYIQNCSFDDTIWVLLVAAACLGIYFLKKQSKRA